MASQPRYRVVVYDLDAGETETVIMEAEGEAFQVAVGAEPEEGRMSGERGVGGVVHLCEHLADLIAANPTSSTR